MFLFSKVLLDIVCENTAGHFLKLVMLEPESLREAKILKDLHVSHPQLEGDWIFIGPDAEKLPEIDAQNTDSSFTYHNFSLDSSQARDFLQFC